MLSKLSSNAPALPPAFRPAPAETSVPGPALGSIESSTPGDGRSITSPSGVIACVPSSLISVPGGSPNSAIVSSGVNSGAVDAPPAPVLERCPSSK